MGTHYGPSVICGDGTHQHLATGFVIGTRFHSAPVVRISDARPVHLGHAGKADGRWRLYAFAGANDLLNAEGGVRALCAFLEQVAALTGAPAHALRARTSTRCSTCAPSSSKSHRELDIESMPALLLPRKGRHGSARLREGLLRRI